MSKRMNKKGYLYWANVKENKEAYTKYVKKSLEAEEVKKEMDDLKKEREAEIATEKAEEEAKKLEEEVKEETKVEEPKKGLFTRVKEIVVNVFKTVTGFFGKLFKRNGK